MKNIRITAAALLACCLLVPSLAEPGYSPDSPAINNKPTTQPINIVIGEGQEKAVPITKKGIKTTPVIPNPHKNSYGEQLNENGNENINEGGHQPMVNSPPTAQVGKEVNKKTGDNGAKPTATPGQNVNNKPNGKSPKSAPSHSPVLPSGNKSGSSPPSNPKSWSQIQPQFPFVISKKPTNEKCGGIDSTESAVVLTVSCAAGECAAPDSGSSRVESTSVTKFGAYTVDMEIPSGGALETSDVMRYFTFTPSKVSPSSSPEEGANVINIENVGFRMFTAAAQSGNDDSKTEISCFIDAKSVNKALGSAPKGDATQTLDRAEAQDKAQPAGGVVETFGAVIDTQPIKPSDSVDVADQNEDSESKKYTIGVYPEYIEYLVDGSVVHQVRAAAIAEKWGMPEAENVLFACNGGKAIFGIDSNPSRTKGAPKKDAATQSSKASEQQKSLCMTVKSVGFEAKACSDEHPTQSANNEPAASTPDSPPLHSADKKPVPSTGKGKPRPASKDGARPANKGGKAPAKNDFPAQNALMNESIDDDEGFVDENMPGQYEDN